MSHNVQYVMVPRDIDPDRYPARTVGSGIPPEGTDTEFGVETPDGEVRCIFSQDAGIVSLWTNINYYRFLYDGEKAEAVAFLDRWVEDFCSRAVRVDGSLLDEWLSERDESTQSPADIDDLVRWASNKEAEGTYWKRVARS
jgi:hypothetical protein